jgi:uncharacterized protein YdbL (DUF1318 family)
MEDTLTVKRKLFPVVGAALLLAACVTINVYFPAGEVQDAADEVIEGVWKPGEPRASAAGSLLLRAAAAALALVVPAAQAAEVDIDISSPAVKKIRDSMTARHARLAPYYASGAVGLTRDALIDVRDLSAVALPERNTLRKLVADENADRQALYREIARANGHPEWEGDIRQVFARRWIEKKEPGWYYVAADGQWRQ